MTGVQTCALPIFASEPSKALEVGKRTSTVLNPVIFGINIPFNLYIPSDKNPIRF